MHVRNAAQLGIDTLVLESHRAGEPSLVQHAAYRLPRPPVVREGEAGALRASVVQPAAAHEGARSHDAAERLGYLTARVVRGPTARDVWLQVNDLCRREECRVGLRGRA